MNKCKLCVLCLLVAASSFIEPSLLADDSIRISRHDSEQIGSLLLRLLPEEYMKMDPRAKYMDQMILEGSIIPPNSYQFETGFVVVVSASGKATLYGAIPNGSSIRDQIGKLQKQGDIVNLRDLSVSRITMKNTPELRRIVASLMELKLEVAIPNDFWMHGYTYSAKFRSTSYKLQLTFSGAEDVAQEGIRNLVEILNSIQMLLMPEQYASTNP